jgi:uncharacterized protein (DUF2336 family)
VSEAIDLTELAKVARDKSPEGRGRLFSLLARFFLSRGIIMSAKERLMLAEILRLLRDKSPPEARLSVAYEIAGSAQAVPELLMILAEDETEIASPILFGASNLTDADLIRLIENPGGAQARVIATRKSLDEAPVDALMRLSDPDIARALLENPGAKFSISALSLALELAEKYPDLQAPLAQRPELLEAMAEEMAGWAAPEIADSLSQRFQLGLSAASATPLPKHPESPASPQPNGDAEPLSTHELGPKSLIGALRAGNHALFEAQLAELATLRIGLVRRLVAETGRDSLALIARGIGLSRGEFAQIYLLARKLQSANGRVGAADLGQALDLYDRTNPNDAKSVLMRWRSKPEPESLTPAEAPGD